MSFPSPPSSPGSSASSTPLEEVIQKLMECGKKLTDLVEVSAKVIASAAKLLAKLELTALQWALDKLYQIITEFCSKVKDSLEITMYSMNAFSIARDLRDFLDEKFTPAFKTLDQDVIDGMPTKRHDLKGDAYSSYSGLVGKQVKAASDMVNASTKLSSQLNSAIVAGYVFAGGLVVAVISAVFGFSQAAFATAAVPEGTAAAPFLASETGAAFIAAASAIFSVGSTAWSSSANGVRAIKEIELVGSNKWPNSNLDYQEG